MRAVRTLTTTVAAGLAAMTAYLLVLLAAAGVARRRPAAAGTAPPLRWLVLMPAHDEELVIADTLAAFAGVDRAAEADIVVVADHCTDRTAELARKAGATVLERDGGDRGKGAALRWALGELGPRLGRADAVLVFDADCRATQGLLPALDRRMAAGARVVQAAYEVANADAGTGAALRDAAFRLMNVVRPLGKDALGLSAGLRGTGMAFRREVLEEHGWGTSSLVEDHEHHLALVAAGERVGFVAEESVRSVMPATLAGSRDQQLRWESGRWALLCTWGPPLARGAVRRRDPVRADALLNMLVPPQSLLLAGCAALTAVAAALRAGVALRLAATALASQAVFVLGGMAVTGAPASTYRALAYAPLLVAQKLGLVVHLARGRGPRVFVRTDREA